MQATKLQMQYSGVSIDDYIEAYGFDDEDDFRESLREDCEDMIKMYMICQMIYEKEGLEVTDEDLQRNLSVPRICPRCGILWEGYANLVGMNNVSARLSAGNRSNKIEIHGVPDCLFFR